ncbi:MAG: ABC transporter substrate-binding protein [Gallionella sp.]
MQNLFGGKYNLLAVILGAVVLLAGALLYGQYGRAKPGIKIGVLHSLSGAMAASEAPLVDAVRLAVEETNESGGLNGQQIEMIVADCRSDDAYCAQQAEKLITRDGAQALFGCRTSSCRKAVKAIVEKHHHLLFYPLQHEGLEQSPDIIYTGATPNQQIIPMALWALQQKGKRFYLIGSDDIFPRTANLMVKDVLLAKGGQLLGERYIPLGAGDMAAVVQEIAAQHPDFVLNTLHGDSNLHFFRALHEAGISAEKTPVFSTSIAEAEVAAIGAGLVAGQYAARNYFQSLDNAENKAFVERFKQRFGRERVLDDPMEAAYIGVKLWANSVRNSETADLTLVKNSLVQQSMAAPQGIVAVDFDTRHLWKTVRIGRARPDGQFDIVWQSEAAVHPEPFHFYHSRQEWFAVQRALTGAAP